MIIISRNVNEEVADDRKAVMKTKITRIMLDILNVSPLIGLVVFTLLFTFVLRSRLEERILHSATTFFLWMFATLYYIMILANFKKVGKMIAAGAAMIGTVAAAITVTPLDRYVNLIFARTHIGAYIIACVLLLAFYGISIHWRRKIES